MEHRLCMKCMEEYDSSLSVCPHCGYEAGSDNGMYVLHLEPGTVLHKRYIVGKALGYGSFGVTYIGYDRIMRRKVAIKEYLPSEYATRRLHEPELILPGSEAQQKKYQHGMERFHREAEKLAKLGKVDGVVYIYDTFEDNHTAYIVMEYLNGETLASYLSRKGKMSEGEAMDIMVPLLQALETVHEQGIIHRDISPDNIFLCKDAAGKQQVKLIDFGAAKFASSSHSKSLTVLLRPGYSPEEQYRTTGEQGTYTDVYAAAAVLYQMVTGIKPADALERRTAIERKKKDLLALPGKVNPELSDNFETALMNALNVKIEDRTATAGEFLGELISYEKVKRKGSSIRRIDFMRWPLWAKIGAPLAAVGALALVVGIAFWISNLATAEESMDLPEGYTYVSSLLSMTEAEAAASAENSSLLLTQAGTQYRSYLPGGIVLSQDLAPFAIVPVNTFVSVVVSTSEEVYRMPDVLGYDADYGTFALTCMGIEVDVQTEAVAGAAPGSIVSQSIDPYTEVKTGERVTLHIAEEAELTAYTAPNVEGLTLEEARAAAADAGTAIVVTEKVFAEGAEDNVVLTQAVAAGEAGEGALEVTVSLMSKVYAMPNLVYKSEEVALQLLKNIGADAEIIRKSNEMLAGGLVSEQGMEKDTELTPGDSVQFTVSSGTTPFEMPSVVGMKEEEAGKLLREKALVVATEYAYEASVDVGAVIRQSIEPGSDITRGSSVTLTVCSKDALVQLENYVGRTIEDAKKAAEQAGFKVTVAEVNDEKIAAGTVMSQIPEAGTSQKPDTNIILTVSKGPELVKVPNVYGMSESDARGMLQDKGFDVDVSYTYSSQTRGTVISQNPAGDTEQKKGTVVSITVSLGPEETKPPVTTAAPTTAPTTASTEPKPQTVTVSFDGNGGSAGETSRTVTVSAAYGSLPGASRDYYTFLGWYTAKEGGTKVESSSRVDTAQNHILYAHWSANSLSDWTLASAVPAGADIREEQWSYDQTEYATGSQPTMDGWQQTGSSWVPTNSGTWVYASYPSGFNTSSSLYGYQKQALSAYETETDRRVITDSGLYDYIYWHWSYALASPSTANDRPIGSYYGAQTNYGKTTEFAAFETTTAYGHKDSNGKVQNDVFFCNRGNKTDNSWWWFRFDVNYQNYSDYVREYTFSRVTEVYSSSNPEGGAGVTNVRHWVRYVPR